MDCSDSLFILQECKGYVIVMPAISVSNAGQLAVDLLIQSTGAKKVGNIWQKAFIPLIGAHPYKDDSTDICTEFEVYQLKQHKILLVQFRSPVWESEEEDFLNELVKWFKDLQVNKVIILSSLYDYERTDIQIKEPHIWCCVCPLTQSFYSSNLRALNCRYLEVKQQTETSGIMTRDIFLSGAGFTKNLHLKCMDKELPCVSFFKFCSDGDNTPEALELAKLVDGWLNIVPGSQDKTFIQPPSWKYMFGGPSPEGLFP